MNPRGEHGPVNVRKKTRVLTYSHLTANNSVEKRERSQEEIISQNNQQIDAKIHK